MTVIIKNKSIIDSVLNLEIDPETLNLSDENIIVPLETFLANKASLVGRKDIGVWIDSDEDIERLKGELETVPVVAFNFPSYLDGRAYSSANILRREMAYKGEVRAVGDVRRDQLEQMIRCGFDAFDMAEGQDMQAALDGLQFFSFNYQASIDKPDPLFRHR